MAKKQLPLLENVEIIDTSSDGLAVGKVDGMVVFVNHAVPGDVCDVQLFMKKKNFAQGNPVTFHKYSEHRVKPFCEHFGTCGGCKWQHLNYAQQLIYKQKYVEDALVRIGHLDIPPVKPILGSDTIQHYRNRLDFAFTNHRWLYDYERSVETIENHNALGFHIPGRFDKVFDVKNCHLQPDLQNTIRNEVRDFTLRNGYSYFDLKGQEGLMRSLIFRNNAKGEWMVIVMFHKDDPEKRIALLNHLQQKFPEIKSLLYVINEKRNDTMQDLEIQLHAGDPFIYEEIEGLKFKINPKSFFQTNTNQTFKLYKASRDIAQLTGNELVYDLYTGTGTIANFIARQAKKVVGIEYVEEAIIDARENSKVNNITNTVFFAGDMKNVLNDTLIAEQGRPDVIITDPPRAGMHEDVVKKIIELAPQKIVYISCNPATQARDVALMKDLYTIEEVQPVDMFPHTHHVENIILLIKK